MNTGIEVQATEFTESPNSMKGIDEKSPMHDYRKEFDTTWESKEGQTHCDEYILYASKWKAKRIYS